MMNKCSVLIGVMCAGLLLAGTAEATIWNPTTEFGIDSGNPNGVWSYGKMNYDSSTDSFSSFSLLAYPVLSGYGPLWAGQSGGNYTPSIWFNATSYTQEGVLPGQISLHPGSDCAVVLRWTASDEVAGLVSIVGEFFAGNDGVMQVGVLINGVLVWNGTDAGAFDLSSSLSAGDTVDFVVYGGYASGATPLEVEITYVPEPATMLLLGLGGVLLRRK